MTDENIKYKLSTLKYFNQSGRQSHFNEIYCILIIKCSMLSIEGLGNVWLGKFSQVNIVKKVQYMMSAIIFLILLAGQIRC